MKNNDNEKTASTNAQPGQQPADASKKKSTFSFNLGNPLPALGDYDATKKFTGQIKGE